MPTSPTFCKAFKVHPKPAYLCRASLALMTSLLWLLLAAPPSQAQTPFPLSQFNPWTSGDSDFTLSVAWGDVDGDGDLDLAVGNSGANKVYLNQNGVLQTVAAWASSDSDFTWSVAWGDVDGDGDLDLAAGNDGTANKVYLNQNGVLNPFASWVSADVNVTQSVAWGDMDGDGDLDLAAGNDGGANKVYLNQNGTLQTTAAWNSSDSDLTYSVAWGDADGDGDLDLAVGNLGNANKVYRNENGMLQTTAAWNSGDNDVTFSVAWGDVDGDGDLDLAAGNFGSVDKVYLNLTLNHSLVLQTAADTPWVSGDPDNSLGVAWGDVDGDGDVDLAIANSNRPNKVYLNQGGVLQTTADDPWNTGDDKSSYAVAWGDVDGDGDLDLAVGNNGTNHVYFNQNGVLQTAAGAPWSSADSGWNHSVAWGDMDGDGDLDLAVGKVNGEANNVFLNQNGTLQSVPVWISNDNNTTRSVAWGDVDGDGDLDLAAGNQGGANKVYLNQGGMLLTNATWTSSDSDSTTSVAWGDVDGDGDLDLGIGNEGAANKVYFNQGGVLQTNPGWRSADSDNTTSVAWGDVDGDRDLDLAVGNYDTSNKIYLNQNGVLQSYADWISSDSDSTRGVAWGDMDGDGDLDLAAANSADPNKVYLNQNGRLQTLAAWTSGDGDRSSSVAWGDVDGDGDLDLAVGNQLVSSKVYLNRNGLLQTAADTPWISDSRDATTSIAWGDIDSDGDLDLAVSNEGDPDRVYLNGRFGKRLANNGPAVMIYRPISPAITNYYVPPQLLTNTAIPLAYTLFDPEADAVGEVIAFYSLNGGGQWFPAAPTAGTLTTHLAASPSGTPHTFTWDTFASGFFGQSDNVVVRMMAYSQPRQPSFNRFGTYQFPNTLPGPFQRPYASAVTFPFRVRGTQVRVYTDTVSPANGVANAQIYQIPASATVGNVMSNAGTPYVTEANGYLQGRGQLAVGDQLTALLPITTTAKYTVYLTSATPTLAGLDGFTVNTPGVQNLVVSATNPLILFNLTVSLEWDARKDAIYLAQLSSDLQRASALLYDVTNGQAALGTVTVYHDQAHWEDADIRIHATNRLRPHATIGGSVTEVIQKNLPDGTNPDVQLAFFPGAMEMPATWNRFGESSGSLGEDWPRALAHEFGHYLFFLLEDYLGFDEAGLPIAVSTCPSLMGNVYLDENSEFHPQASWTDFGYDCLTTLQNQTMKRSDWETITAFYPWLHAPLQSYANQLGGPSTLPLAVTQINFVDPGNLPTTLDVPSYYLVKADGSRYLASSSARAFRFHAGNLVDLGQPRQDRLQAWGTRTGSGDRVCVFDMDPDAPAVGCLTVQPGITQLRVTATPDWLPDIVVAPVTTSTLALTVTNVAAGADLRVQIYAAGRPLTTTLSAEIVLGYDVGRGAYTATLPVYLAAFLRLWDANTPVHELVTDFTLGGAPDLALSQPITLTLPPGTVITYTNGVTETLAETATLYLGDGTLQLTNHQATILGEGAVLNLGEGLILNLGEGLTLSLGEGLALNLGEGLTLSLGEGRALLMGRGNALILGEGLTLNLGEGLALNLGEGLTQILDDGNGPVLSSDGQVVLYVDTLDFAPGQFYTLQPATRVPNPPVYATVVGQPYRLAASPGAPAIEGSSLSFRYLGRDVPPGEENFLKVWFYEAGTGTWSPLETILDTVQNSAAATAQGAGLYVLMSSMEIPFTTAGWNLFAYPVQGSRAITEALASIDGSYSLVYGYDPSQPVLSQWPFHTTDPGVPPQIQSLTRLQFGRGYWINVSQPITLYLRGAGGGGRNAVSLPLPPATFFGRITGAEGLIQPGMAVDARVGGILCGTGTTLAIREELFYVVQSVAGCGEGGSAITLSINGIPAQLALRWDNSHVQHQDLTVGERFPLFLPVLVR